MSYCPLLDAYLELSDGMESPILFQRWSMITAVSALVARRCHIKMTYGEEYPNIYAMLLGPPAARKSSAIKLMGRIMREVGYTRIASGSTSKEQFLFDLSKGFENLGKPQGELELDLETDLLTQTVGKRENSEVFICEGEMLDFFGMNNFGFISLVTNMFDNLPYYDQRTKKGDNERIPNPTVSLLGGATHQTFKKMFPVDIIDQGLLSRFLLVHGGGPRKKAFMPPPLDEGLRKEIVEHMSVIYSGDELQSELKFNAEAYEFSRELYENDRGDEIPDPRFSHYNGRRNTHYMKLAMLVAIMNLHSEITLEDCFYANTMLSYTEKFMPVALGEFGIDKAAETTDYVLSTIASHRRGITAAELMKETTTVIKSHGELSNHIVRLMAANKIDKMVSGDIQRYVKVEHTVQSKSELVDYNLLKEYQENPSFDTHVRTDRTNYEAIELQQELADIEVTTKDAAKPKPKSRQSGGFSIVDDVDDGFFEGLDYE